MQDITIVKAGTAPQEGASEEHVAVEVFQSMSLNSPTGSASLRTSELAQELYASMKAETVPQDKRLIAQETDLGLHCWI